MTSAAGLAMGGMHPVWPSTRPSSNRAFDQIIMDVALHKLPVTMVLDRAGITGSDGPSHNGMWICRCWASCPASGWPRRATARGCVRNSVRHWTSTMADCDTVPKGDVGEDIPALERNQAWMFSRSRPAGLVTTCCWSGRRVRADGVGVAKRLHNQGIGVTVIDPRWVLPVPDGVIELASQHKLIVTLEDNGVHGGWDGPCRPRCGARTSTCPAATSACPRNSSTTPPGERCWPISGSPTRAWPAGSPVGLPHWAVRSPRRKSASTSTSRRRRRLGFGFGFGWRLHRLGQCGYHEFALPRRA